MNRASFGKLMTGGSKMKYGKRKLLKQRKNSKEEEGQIKREILMASESKDVTVHVTGVSMTGGVKNDSQRSAPTDPKNLEKEKLEIAKSMVEGRISDFNSYQKNVGISEGLMQASDIILETIKNINEEDV